MSKKTAQFFQQEIPNVHVDPELIAHLEQVFPNKLPSNLLENLEDYAMMHGQQQVITYIRRLYEKKV